MTPDDEAMVVETLDRIACALELLAVLRLDHLDRAGIEAPAPADVALRAREYRLDR